MKSIALIAAESEATVEQAAFDDNVQACLESVEPSMYINDTLDNVSSNSNQ